MMAASLTPASSALSLPSGSAGQTFLGSDGRCHICSLPMLRFAKEFLDDDEKAMQFFRSHGVLPESVSCEMCGEACSYDSKRRLWRCQRKNYVSKAKRRKCCNFSVSDFSGTFLRGVYTISHDCGRE